MDTNIDTVTFDLWNTLIIHDSDYDAEIRSVRKQGIIAALAEKGISIGPEDVERGYAGSEKKLAERWSSQLDTDVDEQLSLFLESMGLRPTQGLVETISEPYTDAVLKVMPFMVDGAPEVLREIKKEGYRMALISNTGRTPGSAMRKVLKDYGILDLFDVAVFSNEVGYTKPDRHIFEHTLEALGSKPSSSVHIGDHSFLDVMGARQMGMHSVQVMKYAFHIEDAFKPDIAIKDLKEFPAALRGLGRGN
jgi:HAD superfamily hydrolase (TIGR01509 family)